MIVMMMMMMIIMYKMTLKANIQSMHDPGTKYHINTRCRCKMYLAGSNFDKERKPLNRTEIN